ncbi:nucleotide exchange factor GrpE [Nafulsella turpanensis]|uniref:nucleotide exchange factor GrpE n=1 Tax=Nafulsella turpanensis TaxID=1265690 RepID=UPI000345ED43|nr:nucleotide exchange factor GrpE [Nafulsella turpanensis]
MDQKKELENENIAQEEQQAQEEVTTTEQKNEENKEKKTESDSANSAASQLEKELAEQKDKYLRMYSEFENFRRRTAKEKLDMIKTANESMATALLPVLDDFERAMNAFEKDEQDASVQEGVQLIYNKLKKVLEQKGVTVMDLKQGDEFDAEFQEAITQIPASDEKLKGKIVDVVEKGYMLGDKVIRFAKVVIGA